MNVNQLDFVSAVLLLNGVLAINKLVVTLLANCSWPLAQDNGCLPHYPVPSSFASPPTQAWTSQHWEFKTQPPEQPLPTYAFPNPPPPFCADAECHQDLDDFFPSSRTQPETTWYQWTTPLPSNQGTNKCVSPSTVSTLPQNQDLPNSPHPETLADPQIYSKDDREHPQTAAGSRRPQGGHHNSADESEESNWTLVSRRNRCLFLFRAAKSTTNKTTSSQTTRPESAVKRGTAEQDSPTTCTTESETGAG